MCVEKMKSKGEITVVVCTYNRADLLAGCLASLETQTLDKDRFEVVVVDNNSTDHTQEVVHRFVGRIENLRVVIEHKQGLSHARNRGWQEAQCPLVGYLDDDAMASNFWCEKVLAAFEESGELTAAVGGKILPWYQVPKPTWFSDVLEIRSCGDSAGFLPPEHARNGFSGSNMAFKKETLSAYGGFNPQFGMSGNTMYFGDETELFGRLFEDARRLWYDPEIKVYHLVSSDNMTLVNRYVRGYRAGVAQAHLQNRQVLSKLYVFNLRKLVFLLVDFPLIPKGGVSWKARYALWLGRFGSTLGYLFGPNR